MSSRARSPFGNSRDAARLAHGQARSVGSGETGGATGSHRGAGIFYEVLCAVSSVDEETLQNALTQLVAAELLYQRGRAAGWYRFKHALIQEAAYAALLRSTRRQYHSRLRRCWRSGFQRRLRAA